METHHNTIVVMLIAMAVIVLLYDASAECSYSLILKPTEQCIWIEFFMKHLFCVLKVIKKTLQNVVNVFGNLLTRSLTDKWTLPYK